MTSDNESAMPTGIANDGEPPTSPGNQVEQGDLPMLDGSEDASPRFPDSQIDGVTDDPDKEFSKHPETVEVAKIQGIALLRAVLHDPGEAIAGEIVKTSGFKGQHASNDRCKNVRSLITGQKKADDTSIFYTLATWCMLGGGIPGTWVDPRGKNRGGEKQDSTEWGKNLYS